MLKSLITTVAILTACTFTLHAAPKDDVVAAAKKLAAADTYSWKSATEGGFSVSAEGKLQKDGLVHVASTFGDNTSEIFIKGDKGAVKTEDGWKTAEEVADAQGPQRFLARMIQNFKSPAVQAQELAEKVSDLKKADEAIYGDLTEEGAKSLMTFGGRRGGNNNTGPAISGAKGTAKFWVGADGVLTKVQYHVEGKMTVNGEDRDIDRTTTVDIKDVGSTKIEVPADAKAKLP